MVMNQDKDKIERAIVKLKQLKGSAAYNTALPRAYRSTIATGMDEIIKILLGTDKKFVKARRITDNQFVQDFLEIPETEFYSNTILSNIKYEKFTDDTMSNEQIKLYLTRAQNHVVNLNTTKNELKMEVRKKFDIKHVHIRITNR